MRIDLYKHYYIDGKTIRKERNTYGFFSLPDLTELEKCRFNGMKNPIQIDGTYFVESDDYFNPKRNQRIR